MLTPAINSPKAYPPVSARPEKEWTVLYVFNGDNDLKENTSHQFMDVVKNGAPDDSYVATFCARGDLEWAPGNIGRKLQHTVSNLFRKKKPVEVPSDWEGNRVFVVDPKGGWTDPVAAPEGEVHQGATISDFLKWGIESFPSRHVAVVFSTHGDAHNGVLMNGQGKEMPLPELRRTLEDAAGLHGRELDLVAFESCNMAEAEVAYELHDVARAMVASPTVLYGVPWEHAEALQQITDSKDGQEGYGEGHGLSIFTPTMRGLFKPLGDKYPKLKMSLEGDWDDFLIKR